jgi:hypothetical protein
LASIGSPGWNRRNPQENTAQAGKPMLLKATGEPVTIVSRRGSEVTVAKADGSQDTVRANELRDPDEAEGGADEGEAPSA